MCWSVSCCLFGQESLERRYMWRRRQRNCQLCIKNNWMVLKKAMSYLWRLFWKQFPCSLTDGSVCSCFLGGHKGHWKESKFEGGGGGRNVSCVRNAIPLMPLLKAITLQPDRLECLLLSFWTWTMGKRVCMKEAAAAEMSVVHWKKANLDKNGKN